MESSILKITDLGFRNISDKKAKLLSGCRLMSVVDPSLKAELLHIW